MDVYRNIDTDEERRPGESVGNTIEYQFEPSLSSWSGLDGDFKLLSTLGSVGGEEILKCDNEVNLQLPFEMKGGHRTTSQILNRNRESIYQIKVDILADTMRYVIQTTADDKNVALVRAPKTFQLNLNMKYFQTPGDYHSIRHIELQTGLFQQTSLVCEEFNVIAVIKRKRIAHNLFNPLERFTIHVNHPSDIHLALISMACMHGQLLTYKILTFVLLIFAGLFVFIIL
ncbi:uncharacterized protein FA14DRAFT_178143 [Meira miltonrushii]|uniref:Uncharacterized protein n=1 Tax=Meira miltonrushii TaxID=1280837 RepID=A0A316VGW3_9BASI|nr:uncharacterized protein FA14DRAFT_178143 [Meira miltonrushii]PWN34745.1 hypothetical protein FA14DRAFT_178143 [Meira miltonrushii]